LARGLALFERLVQEHPEDAEYGRDLRASLNPMGYVLLRQGKWTEAAERLDRSIELMKCVPPPNPGEPEYAIYAKDLVIMLSNRISVYLAVDDRRGAARGVGDLCQLAR